MWYTYQHASFMYVLSIMCVCCLCRLCFSIYLYASLSICISLPMYAVLFSLCMYVCLCVCMSLYAVHHCVCYVLCIIVYVVCVCVYTSCVLCASVVMLCCVWLAGSALGGQPMGAVGTSGCDIVKYLTRQFGLFGIVNFLTMLPRSLKL